MDIFFRGIHKAGTIIDNMEIIIGVYGIKLKNI